MGKGLLRGESSDGDGLGIDLNQVAAVLEASLDGRKATVLSVGDEERDVVLKLPRVRRAGPVSTPSRIMDCVELVLGDVARFIPEEGAREIYRRDQRRVARVTARIAPGFATSREPWAVAPTPHAGFTSWRFLGAGPTCTWIR